jgi:hypothetical protein
LGADDSGDTGFLSYIAGRTERLTGSVAIERFEQAGLTGVVLDE